MRASSGSTGSTSDSNCTSLSSHTPLKLEMAKSACVPRFTRRFSVLLGARSQRPISLFVPQIHSSLLAKMAYCPLTTCGMLMWESDVQVEPSSVAVTAISTSVVAASGTQSAVDVPASRFLMSVSDTVTRPPSSA